MLFSILCTMGLPAIDESLDALLTYLGTMPEFLGTTEGLAKAIGCLIALCVGAYECWMMMLGRRGMDVMKILKIIGFSICITSSGFICSVLRYPSETIEVEAKAMAQAQNKLVGQLELKVAEKQASYLVKLRQVQDSIAQAQKVAEIGEDAAWYEELVYNVSNLGQEINNLAQRATVAMETKMSEWINDIIRFIGELIFQMTYYGILVSQKIFMAILACFCPLMFALSLAPPFSSAWSQWTSKYVSLSFWAWVTYVCLYYIDALLVYNLEADITAYDYLLKGDVTSWGQIGALGLQGIGSNCMYAMGMIVGAYVLRFVPEVASWLIPGGISSGAGQAAGGVVTGGAQAAASAGMGAASTGMGVASAALGWAGKNSENALKNKGY